MTQSPYQLRGSVARKAKANLRFQRARDISDAGGTIEDAAEATGMTIGSIRQLLYTRVGSKCWPIKGE